MAVFTVAALRLDGRPRYCGQQLQCVVRMYAHADHKQRQEGCAGNDQGVPHLQQDEDPEKLRALVSCPGACPQLGPALGTPLILGAGRTGTGPDTDKDRRTLPRLRPRPARTVVRALGSRECVSRDTHRRGCRRPGSGLRGSRPPSRSRRPSDPLASPRALQQAETGMGFLILRVEHQNVLEADFSLFWYRQRRG